MKILISVIIATRNRQEDLEKVIWSLLNQEKLPSVDFEFIVVDNNSTDDTEQVIGRLMPKSCGRLKYYKQELRGKSNALNMGIEKSQGQIIAFTDDDVELDKDWLFMLFKAFEQHDCDGIGGRVLPIYPEHTPAWVSQNPRQAAGAVVIYDQGDRAFLADETTERFIGSNWAFKRSVFKDCGMFNPALGPGMPVMGEDEEFYNRVVRGDKKLYYCPEVLIHHPVDLNRLSLKNAADWHLSLGRFQAYKQMHERQDNVVYYFGIPRYIIKNVILSALQVLVTGTNRLAFWNAYRNLYCNIGMIQEYWHSQEKG